jgi:hypothetical protein
MTDDRGEIKIRYTLKQGKNDALGSEPLRIIPVSGWKISLILVPTLYCLSLFKRLLIFHFFTFISIRGDYSWLLDLVDTSKTAQVQTSREFGG